MKSVNGIGTKYCYCLRDNVVVENHILLMKSTISVFSLDFCRSVYRRISHCFRLSYSYQPQYTVSQKVIHQSDDKTAVYIWNKFLTSERFQTKKNNNFVILFKSDRNATVFFQIYLRKLQETKNGQICVSFALSKAKKYFQLYEAKLTDPRQEL